jgi:two-component system, cell cycle sensor histidine kinase and response regulator CckA
MTIATPSGASGPAAPALTAEVLRLFQELPFIGMAVTSPESKRWLQVNQTLCDMLGYSQPDLMERTWADVTHPDDLEADTVEYQRVMRGEIDGYKQDKRFVRQNGEVIHGTLDVKAIRGANGSVDFFVATVADITARVRAEAKARGAAVLLRELAHQVPGVIYQYRLSPNGDSGFPFASDGIRDIYGVTPDEVREDASPVFDRIHPDDLPEVAESILESATSLEPWECEFRVILPEKGVRWLTGQARPQRLPDGSTLWHGYVADTTQQHLAREALLQSEERFRIQVEHAPEAIVVLDADAGRFTDVNSNAERLFRASREELLREGVLRFSPLQQPDGRLSSEAAAHYVQQALEGGTPVFDWTHQDASGIPIPCEVRLVRLPYQGRSLVRGSITDISEAKQSRDMLLRLQAAIDSSLNGIAICDLEGTLTYVNRACLSLWGMESAASVLGSNVRRFWRDTQEPEEVMAAIGATGAWSGEMTAVREGGEERTFQVNASLFTDSAGVPVGMLASFADVTDARMMQLQLLQAQKMESVGRLAGGIAHDFNNLLTVIRGYLDIALESVPPGSEVRGDLGEARRAADSAAALTRQLLTFSRRQMIAPEVLDLNVVVHRVQAMLQRVLGTDIILEVRTDLSPARVRFDPNQAEQVLVNLAVNARDAMPAGGRLELRTSHVRVGEGGEGGHPGLEPGEYVVLAVSDTGEGMTPEVQAHVFEPFFTTKEPGRGTGLGLPMIHGAVTQNGGTIELESAPGRGTTFRILLPRTPDAPSPTREPHGSHSAAPGDETIVLVEDDPLVRGLTQRLLQRLGYRVHVFQDGGEAFHWLQERPGPLHLLLTDVVMPGMTGRELAERVRALHPEIAVLFSSGYTADVLADGPLPPRTDFLAKPFTVDELAIRLRRLLDVGSPSG